MSCAGAQTVRPADAQVRVRPAIDVLLTDSLHLVRHRSVGLVTNQAGVDADGISDVTRLRAAGVELVALFSPEHGFRGAADPGAAVASSKDSATGLPIYSLYGRTSAPTEEMMRGVDVMVVDLQDAGARYYTYLATTVEVMRSAGKQRLSVIVLDRPNPIGGLVQGNVLDPAFSSSIGLLSVPMRHGLTIGELARLAKADLSVDVALTVVPVQGWRRNLSLDETNLPFIPPSPNLRTIESLFHYPGLCLFEGTNLSVGRGSDRPFEQIGAPWLDTAKVLAEVRRNGFRGVEFRSARFTPRQPGDGKFPDTLLAGIRLRVTDRRWYDPTATAVYLLAAIQHLQPDQLKWIPAHFDRLAGGPDLRLALQGGVGAAEIVAGWTAGMKRFEERRTRFLLYPAVNHD
jgi:uncharacterized protein YbbC (DUF1343 family)